ncbi:MAG: clostripain-related cysteine peptidase [Pseudothermotoga sp.]
MRRVALLIALVPLLCGCVYIFKPSDMVYELADELYAGKVYYLKIGFKNSLGFLMSYITIKVDTVEYKTDDYGYATIPIYYEEVGTKELKIEYGSMTKTLQISIKKPSWLVFLWLASDNNLDRFVDGDFQEMAKAAEDISTIVVWDSSDPSRDGIYALTNDSKMVKIEKTNELNSGDGTLFREYTKRFSEIDSDYKALIIWNHGLSWIDVTPESYRVKGIAYDDQSKDFLKISEIAQNVTGKWDVLGMDACLMGSVEVIYALREIADYIVASAYEIQGTGWDYSFLSRMSGKDPFEFCKELVDYYREFYKNNFETSLAVYKTDAIDDAIDSFEEFLMTPPVLQNSRWTNYSQTYCLYDLGEVLETLGATETLEKFDKVVVYKHLSNAKSQSLATSIFVCQDRNKIDTLEYASTEFAQNTSWDEFLLNQ